MDEAIEIKTPECGYRALAHISSEGQGLFKTTKDWLVCGECRYPFLVFDDDQWTGSNSNEIIHVREDGKLILRKLKIKKI